MEAVEALCSIAHVASEDEVRDCLQRLPPTALITGEVGIVACQRAIKSNPDVGVCRAFLEQPQIRQNVNNVVPANFSRGAPTTLLHAAVLRGADMVRLLLALPEVDLNLVCPDGLTPLHLACSLSRDDVLQLLLNDRRVDLTATTLDRRTALHCACEDGNATSWGGPDKKWEVVHMLVRAAATDCLPWILNARDSSGRTALHYAAGNNHTAVVQELLDADAGASDARSNYAVMFAQDSRGRMAVHIAAQKGHQQVVRLLLRRAPHTLHIPDDEAMTPLQHAVRGGHLHILQDWVPQCVSTSQPLMTTFIELLKTTTHYEVAVFLLQELDHQLQVSSPTRLFAPSLLHWAVESPGAILIPHILKWQPHLANEILDQERNQTPLHVATISGQLDVVEALCVEQGWSLHANWKDKFSKTALDYAYALGHKDVCEHLMQRKDVKEYIGMLQKEQDTYVTAANAILVVAVLMAGSSYASCVQPLSDSFTGHFSYLYIIVPMTFLTSVTATVLGACAALPFSFGLYVGKHSSICHSDYIGHKVRRIRVLVALASYFLLLSLATMVFSFSCSVFGMGSSSRTDLLACAVFSVAFSMLTILVLVSYFSRAIFYRAKQLSIQTRKSFKLPVIVKPSEFSQN